MIRAIRLFPGSDGSSHVEEGYLDAGRAAVTSLYVAESPAHSALDWHDAPERQYVITLSGTLEFTTRNGETFVLHPGDMLIAEDRSGTGHSWRLIDNDPWRRAYVVLAEDAAVPFVATGKARSQP